MLRSLIAFSLFSFFYSLSIAQPPPSGGSPCPNPPCSPIYSPYKYEDVINAERVGHLQLNQPYGISTGKEGRVYMFEPYFNQIVILNSNGSHYKTVSLADYLQYDYVLAIDIAANDKVYVSTYYKILVLDSEGNFLNEIIPFTNSTSQPFYVYDIAVDSQGKIYVANAYGGIFIFSESGELQGTLSEVTFATSLAITSNDDLLALDYYNNRVVRYRGGLFLDDPIQLTLPYFISVDSQDNIYILNYILKDNRYEPQLNYYNSQYQLVNTLNGVDQENFQDNYLAYFFYYGHIAAVGPQAIYITNSYGNELLKVDMVNGSVATIIRSDWSGQVNGPKELSTDSFGNVYVVDGVDGINQKYRIQVFDYKGNYVKDWKNGKIGPGNIKLHIDSEDNFYVTTYGGSTEVFNAAGELQSSFNTMGIDFTTDGTNYYVLGKGESLITVYTKHGEFVRVIPDNPGWEDDEIDPVALEVSPSGEIIVAKYGELLVFANDGTFIKTIGSYGHEDGQFSMISALHIDEAGLLYVGDYQTVQVLDSEGNFLQRIGSIDYSDPASFWIASGIAVKNGRLYVSNLYSNEVRIYSKLPTLQVADVDVNYKDRYHFFPSETEDGNRITYRIKDGNAASLSFGNMLDLNSAGAVVMEALVEASTTMSKSSDEFVVHIAKANLKFSFVRDFTREYGEVNPNFSIQSPYYSAVVDGLRGDDDLIEIDELPVITTEANETSSVGEYAISFTGGIDDNYDFEFTSGKLTVTKSPLQLLADNKSREYGDANPEFTYQAIGFKNNDDVQDLDSTPQLTTTATLESPADTYPITFSVGEDNNYYTLLGSGELTVTKAPLQVKAHNASRPYGEVNPSFTVTFEGFKNSDTQDILIGIPTPYSEAVANSPVGQYPIIFNNNIDLRYYYITTPATLTIEKANQEITFVDLPSPIDSDADPFSIGAYASTTSNLPITFSIVSGPATINGVLVTLTGEGGMVTVKAEQPGNSNYHAAESVLKIFEVNLITGINEEPGSLTVYPNPANDVLRINSVEGVKYQLLNASGGLVSQFTNSFITEHAISTEALTKGIYLLVLQTASGNRITRKISVVK